MSSIADRLQILRKRSSSGAAAAKEWTPSFSPWLIAASVMLATFMEVLDTSVANVALPHIAGNLSASTEESTWVLTSYLVSNAIILPATNWLGRFFGRKRFLIAKEMGDADEQILEEGARFRRMLAEKLKILRDGFD